MQPRTAIFVGHLPPTAMQLRVRDLTKTYPNGVHALRGVSLTIDRGMYGLLGPNGAGKSSLMRTIATLQEPDAGTVAFEVDGRTIDVVAEKEATRRLLGYLPQDFGLYPKVSAEDLLDHFAVLKGVGRRSERKALVRQLLEQTNLWESRRKHVGTYSGGMRQRFGIAVALLGDPRLIIVDEPTAGLDPAERVRFLNLLSALGERAVVILSTHIVEDVAELCSRMAIIRDGAIVAETEPLEALAALDGRIWRRLSPRGTEPDTDGLAVVSTKLLAGQQVVHVYSDGAPGPDFEAVTPDLEDVYFAAMNGIATEALASGDGALAEPPDLGAPA